MVCAADAKCRTALVWLLRTVRTRYVPRLSPQNKLSLISPELIQPPGTAGQIRARLGLKATAKLNSHFEVWLNSRHTKKVVHGTRRVQGGSSKLW